MVKSISLLPFAFVATAAFTGQPLALSRPSTSSSNLYMGGAAGYATTPAGKREIVSKIKGLLDTSQMVFTVPASSMTVSQAQQLRESMPEGTSVTVVKNTLMTRAVEGGEFEGATAMLQGAHMWFFIEEDISASIKAYEAFLKDTGKQETHGILGGILDGTNYDSAGVAAIGKLPTKDELYAKIAGAIKAVPTKVARIIKAPNSKLAKAIKLATDKVHE